MTISLGTEGPALRKALARKGTLHVPVTDQERFRIRMAALKCHKKQSDFAREAILEAVELLENEE